MSEVLGIIVIVVLCLALAVFMRALTVRLMLGKWPHQSDEAADLMDYLNRNT